MRSGMWINLSSALILLFCIFALSLWKPASHKNLDTAQKEKAFFTHLHLQQYDEQGNLKSDLHTERLGLFDNQEMRMEKPIFFFKAQDNTPWTAQSEKGFGFNNGERVFLLGHVHLIQWPAGKNPRTDIQTHSLNFYPKKSFANTADIIRIQQAETQIQGQGFHADLKKNTYTLEKRASIKKGDNTLHSDHLTYDRKTGQMQATPLAHHRTVINLEPTAEQKSHESS